MGATRDIVNKLSAVVELVAANYTADPDPDGVDMQEAQAVVHRVNVGVSGDTLSGSVKIDLVLQESDDDSTWTAVTDVDNAIADIAQYPSAAAGAGLPNGSGIFQTIDAAAEDETLYSIGYRGTKRYSRVLPDFTGTHTNGTPIGIVGERGMLHRGPLV
jgi:hypothetical protein